jgi:hypothetical protein
MPTIQSRLPHPRCLATPGQITPSSSRRPRRGRSAGPQLPAASRPCSVVSESHSSLYLSLHEQHQSSTESSQAVFMFLSDLVFVSNFDVSLMPSFCQVPASILHLFSELPITALLVAWRLR